MLSRNTPKGYAHRVRKNLDFIIKSRNEGNDVHEVTQLVLSLLGLIVFPWEAHALKSLESLCLSVLEEQGWPRWNIQLGKKEDTNTLGKLIWHLRNAISHRRLSFSSDDLEMGKVEIMFKDGPHNKPINWCATINAADLKGFCDRFTKRLEELVD